MAQKALHSLVYEYFPDEECRWELIELSHRTAGIVDMSAKQDMLFEICEKYGIDASPRGEGTNRFGFKIGQYCFKFAINREGRVNNKNELRRCKMLYPNVTLAHECTGDGTLLVCEYVRAFQTFAEMKEHELAILEKLRIMHQFLIIGDVGVTSKNFGNWGMRGKEVVCLDTGAAHYANSDIYRCSECDSFVRPTPLYDKLKCPGCSRMYNFEDIERRISENDFDEDIGDLDKVAYIIHSERELVTLDHRSPHDPSHEDPNEVLLTLDSRFNIRQKPVDIAALDEEYFRMIGEC